MGYRGERHFGTTSAYRLEIDSLAIEPVETSGDAPGWISRHKARLVKYGIVVTGGNVGGIAATKPSTKTARTQMYWT